MRSSRVESCERIVKIYTKRGDGGETDLLGITLKPIHVKMHSLISSSSKVLSLEFNGVVTD